MKKALTNGVSSPSIGMSRMLLGSRPTITLGATSWGTTHMVHAYELREWTNPHGANFTDWCAPCGAKGTESGHFSKSTCSMLSSLDFAHQLMLCKNCCSGMF